MIEQIETLSDQGAIADSAVEVWGSQIPADAATETAIGKRIRGHIEAFRSWARDHDRSLEPFFQKEPVDSGITDEAYARIRIPTMTLAESEDGDLRFVTPSADGERALSVSDRLAALQPEPDAKALTADTGP